MKKFVAFFILGILILGFSKVTTYAYVDKGQKVILIDPGHGGSDGGAKGKSGANEKIINLQIGLKLKQKLEAEGYKVFITRDSDTHLSIKKREDLEKRSKMKLDTKCDVFISIHQNKFPQPSCFGAQVWYSDNSKSKTLAYAVQNSLKETIQDKNRRVPKCARKDYKILRDNYDGASIILECGFISNYEEEIKLKTDEHQDKIVQGISLGLEKYFSN